MKGISQLIAAGYKKRLGKTSPLFKKPLLNSRREAVQLHAAHRLSIDGRQILGFRRRTRIRNEGKQ